MNSTLSTVVLFFAFAGLAAVPSAKAADISGRASIIDGDTIEIRGQRVRFDGIDAPETRQRCEDGSGRPYRCGKVAADALDAFLAKSRPTTCTITGKSWDRLVGTCKRADGADVNGWMVSQGLAIDWPKYSRGRYASEQANAKAARRGMWAGRFERPCVVRGANCE